MHRTLLLLFAVMLTGTAASVPAARASYEAPGARALDWAEAHATGCWYAYGGTSCAQGYDCSGLVMEAVLHADGITLPHNAAMMTWSWHLYRIPLSQAQRGDLLTWGWPAYHIAFRTAWYNQGFAAQHSGTRVGWFSYAYWQPSAAWRLRLPGRNPQQTGSHAGNNCPERVAPRAAENVTNSITRHTALPLTAAGHLVITHLVTMMPGPCSRPARPGDGHRLRIAPGYNGCAQPGSGS